MRTMGTFAAHSGEILLRAAHTASSRPYSAEDSLFGTVFAALGLEAWVNEFLYVLQTTPEAERHPPLDRLYPMITAANLQERGTSLTTKLSVTCAALTGNQLDWGSQPWQDVTLLIDIRNFIVHQRPEVTPIDIRDYGEDGLLVYQEKLHNLGERLVSRKIVERPDRSVVTAAMSLVTKPPVAPWAVTTSAKAITSVLHWLPPSSWPRFITVGLQGLVAVKP
jgi:hypothetical protein